MDHQAVRDQLERALAEHEWEFERFFLARFFGLRVSYGDETCVVEIPTAEFMYNPQGTGLHGGVLAFAVDVSMGHLCNRFLSTAVTLEIKLQFLRPIRGPAVCEARFLKKGRSVVSIESRVRDEDGALAAFATGTWQRLRQ